MTETPPTTALPDPLRLRAELDATLADAIRRATTRAEHIRLVRIAGLIAALDGGTAA